MKVSNKFLIGASCFVTGFIVGCIVQPIKVIINNSKDEHTSEQKVSDSKSTEESSVTTDNSKNTVIERIIENPINEI